MLSFLHIENIAVIQQADIAFSPGMNVLTGETGAGKSIVIDAIGAVLGGRVSKDLVRSGAENALVTAIFSSAAAEHWCAENGLPCEDQELSLLRRIAADGRSVCRINGVPVTAHQLRDLGSLLLDIHGQNDGQHLLNENYHLQYLDNFGNLDDLRRTYQAAYAAYQDTQKAIAELEMDEGEKARRVEELQRQIDELEAAHIRPGEWDELEAKRVLLTHAEKLTGNIETAFACLYGLEEQAGVTDLLGEAAAAVGQASRYSPDLSPMEAKIQELQYAAEDVAEQLRDLRDRLDFTPEDLDALLRRLDQLSKLSRKYGSSEADMLSYLEQAKKELDTIEYAADRVQHLEKQLQAQYAAAKEAAEDLSAQRRAAAQELEKRILQELAQLNMPSVRFRVEFTEKTCPGGLDKSGKDVVRFLLSANAGEELGRISKIASGGELSRIMLAMKNVLSENDGIETMIFDEIDTGVSGVAAQRVGEKLAQLAMHRQVICVTHLPQIAVMADTHFLIEKREMDGRTFTAIQTLDHAQRKEALARMSSGDHVTAAALESAEEALQNAKRYKQSLQ